VINSVTNSRPIDFLKQLTINTIIEGGELSPGQLQLIVAVLRGKTRGLGALYIGAITEFEMCDNILGYKPKKGKGRPPGTTIEHKYTCMILAEYFQYLRTKEGVLAEDAYQIVTERSCELIGRGLGRDAVVGYITDGNKYIVQETERVKSIFGL